MSIVAKVTLAVVALGTVAVLLFALTVGRRTKKKWKREDYYYDDTSWWP